MLMSETKTLETRTQRIGRVLRQAINGEEQDFTSGSIDRAIVLLSIPMILEMAMESLFAIVDAFFVAKVGVEAVATVGLTESVLTLVYSIAIGLSAAATAMVARRVGEGDRDAAAKAGAQVILIALVMSAVIAVPGNIFAADILRIMAHDESVSATGHQFTRLMLTANLPILLLWMLNGIFRGAGDAATAMRALWLANAVNIVLCPLFIFGWGPVPAFGVLGSGIATTIGRSTGVAYQLWNLFQVGKIVRLRLEMLRPKWDVIVSLLKLSAGSTGQYLIASASWIFMISILGQIGKEVTAGYTIAIRIVIFALLPAWGMANAAATLVGQNLGAGHPDRAEKSAWRAGFFNMIFLAIIGGICLITAPDLIRLFTQQPEAVHAGSLALRILAGGYVFYGWGMILSQAINGAGDTRTPTILNFIFFWLVETPLAALLALHLGWGQTGVYWSIVIAESGMALAAMWVFRQGKWKTVKV
ncbi:MAG TPA: MATE family efflux transporter [Saprospiraceae bacterium]|nr:MATE family efflux transporter [Saprospiraceae bacterium]